MNIINVWKKIIIGDEKSWVLFRNGTCVIFTEKKENIKEDAIKIMKEWGPVNVGCSAGDFTTIDLQNHPGWAVTSHHNDILTYVAPEEINNEANDIAVGLLGRSKRDEDAKSLEVIHIEHAN